MFSSTKLISQVKHKSNPLLKLISKASICHKTELPPNNTYRWPYEKRGYYYSNCLLDPRTKKKFNENSKIIQVEGNVFSGKEEFAKKLADELGMHYMPRVDLDNHYVNYHGYDYRALNPLLPERLRFCDWSMFHENPTRHSVVHMHFFLFKLRLLQYLRALQHLFNTGQGVVLVHTPFTERVHVEALSNLGWLPLGYLRGDGLRFYDYKLRHNHIRNLILGEYLTPHLTIYLDRSVDECLDRIKKSPNPIISNSKALIPEFLENIEKAYNDIVLPKTEMYGHLLRCNVPENHEEVIDIVDEIKKLDFEYDYHDTRFHAWDTSNSHIWHLEQRIYYTSMRCIEPLGWTDLGWFDIAGLGDSISEIDLRLREVLYEVNVGDLGVTKSLKTDTRFSNFFTALIDYADFGHRFESHFKADIA